MKIPAILVAVLFSLSVQAGPVRVALLDFDDQVGLLPDDQLGGKINLDRLVEKAPTMLARLLVDSGEFDLVDRRDFVAAVDQASSGLGEGQTAGRSAFIQPAQYLNADIVLRGSLMSFSTSKQVVNLGGHHSEHVVLSMRVSLEALDIHNGSVLAVSDASSERKMRQTSGYFSEIGESDMLDLMEEAVSAAVSDLRPRLGEKLATLGSRETVRVTIRSESSPALVELDGVLIGSTPMEAVEVYRGDHMLRVSRPGYAPVSKRVMLDRNVSIDVPLFRSDLDAVEKKEVLKDSDTHVFMGNEVPSLIIKDME